MGLNANEHHTSQILIKKDNYLQSVVVMWENVKKFSCYGRICRAPYKLGMMENTVGEKL